MLAPCCTRAHFPDTPMHVMVLGAGVTGVTTAWYLAEAGHQVSVVDRADSPAMETSFANGGQISVSHPEPWSSPAAPWRILRWLGQEEAPVLWRLRADPAQWRWCAQFLAECLPARHRRNLAHIARLAVHSGACLRELRAQLGFDYAQRTRGILHLYRDEREWRTAQDKCNLLQAHGIDCAPCTRASALDIEPALAHFAPQLSGIVHAPGDESGDAHAFTRALAHACSQRGVRFHFGRQIDGFVLDHDRAVAIDTREPAHERSESLQADAFVVCLASDSPRLMRPLGETLPIYPVKGYSVTAPVRDEAAAPSISLTDESRRIVFSRLGNNLRIAGTAELTGFDLNVRAARIQPLIDWFESAFPGAADFARASSWAGLRPTTPSNCPVIRRSKVNNVWLNTGHGSLGWTLSCGAAQLIGDLICGRKPAVPGLAA